MRAAIKNLILFPSSGIAITYLGKDEFNSAVSAGGLNGTTASDGISTRTATDGSSRMSISVANGLEFSGAPVGVGNPGLWYPSVARAGGLAVADRIQAVSGTIGHRVGFDDDQAGDMRDAFNFITGTLSAYANGTQIAVLSATYSNGVTYDTMIVERLTKGAHFLIRGGAFGSTWIRAFVSTVGAAANYYPAVGQNGAAYSGVFYARKKYWAVLPSAFAAQYDGATVRKATSVNGDTITADSGDAIIEHVITAATGVTQELMVRRVDDNNTLIIRMDQTASKIYLYEKVAGVETEKGAAGGIAQTWTNGTAYRIHVTLYGTVVKVATMVAATGVPVLKQDTTSSLQTTSTGVKVSHAGTDLIAWPLVLGGQQLAEANAMFP